MVATPSLPCHPREIKQQHSENTFGLGTLLSLNERTQGVFYLFSLKVRPDTE